MSIRFLSFTLMMASIAHGDPGTMQASRLADPATLDQSLLSVEHKVIAWRRDIHGHPELGNQEVQTAALVAGHLRGLGLDEVRIGLGGTGVVGVLRGGLPGPVLALRADMDALPIKEETGLPFASTAVVMDGERKVPVMHACGHDAHTAMLMGAAEVLAGMRANLRGTIMFIFQPAEEGISGPEVAGARRMVAEGLFHWIEPDAIFALHVEPGMVGTIDTRPGPFLSSATDITISLEGRQTHAGRPWEGSDLINLSADIVKSLATITSRRVDVFEFPNVASIGAIEAGTRGNVLPGKASLRGTIRTFDLHRRDELKRLINESVVALARSYGVEAEITFKDTALVTGSDPSLLETILPALEQAAPGGVRRNALLRGAAEDFSYFQENIPGVYYILGSTPNFTTKEAAPSNHSDRFDIDERVLAIGVKAHVLSALRFLESRSKFNRAAP